jgi:hypothetical protein
MGYGGIPLGCIGGCGGKQLGSSPVWLEQSLCRLMAVRAVSATAATLAPGAHPLALPARASVSWRPAPVLAHGVSMPGSAGEHPVGS